MQRYFGTSLVVIGLIAVILGTLGFYEDDGSGGWATAFYKAMQLFYWNSSFDESVPWMLEIARWLAPLITFGAILKVVATVFQKRWDGFRARRSRGHVVICGAGEKGSVLASELRQRKSAVVIIDQDAERAETLATHGALALHGDAAQAEVQRRGGTPHAARLIVATGDDHRNLAIAMTAAQWGAKSIHAYCSDSSLCDLYQRNRALTSSQTGAGVVRIFNYERNLARLTIQDFPPDVGEGEVHVVLPDLSPLGGALAVEYALMGHFPDDRQIHLHVVGLDVGRKLAAWRVRYPGIEQCLQIKAHDLPAPEMFASQVAALIASSSGTFTVFPGLAEETLAFSRSLELIEALPERSLRLLLLSHMEDSPMRDLVGRNPALAAHIAFLPLPSRVCGYEAVIGESLDRTARTIHEKWYEETLRQIEAARRLGNEELARRHEAKATFKSWDDLSEEQKGASRSQADHIPFKIRAAGYEPAEVTKAQWAQLSAEQVERLARMEHARWAAYYWMTGWTFSPERNDAHKKHPNLVAYADLDEPTKDYDREAVRNLSEYLG